VSMLLDNSVPFLKFEKEKGVELVESTCVDSVPKVGVELPNRGVVDRG